MVLEDGGGEAAFGGGAGRQLKIAVAVLGSRGGRRTGVGVNVCGLTITALASVLARTAREDTSNARDVC